MNNYLTPRYRIMRHIRLVIWRMAKWVVTRVERSDFSYNAFSHLRKNTYEEYVLREREWEALEAKYGDWGAAYEAEPDKASELEFWLAE